ncbi:hypothetical protein ST27_20730 [Xanthomonas phaseoli pv. phaseoli]|nr:hypothetical protein ST27_20730 [Xanthomonas phaseoli pv. phaseoli]
MNLVTCSDACCGRRSRTQCTHFWHNSPLWGKSIGPYIQPKSGGDLRMRFWAVPRSAPHSNV